MNADPLRAGSGGEEDSWETLAEDLFGIDLGASPAADAQISSEDLLLDEPAPTAPEAKTPTPPTAEPARPAPEQEESARPKRHESRRPERGPARPPRAERTRSAPPPAQDDFGAARDLDAPLGSVRAPDPESPNEEPAGRPESAESEPPRRRHER